MAVLPDLPTLEVEIVVDGEALKEYDDPDPPFSAPNTITKFVEATSGTEFSIKLHFTRDFPQDYAVKAQVLLDGKRVTNKRYRIKRLSGSHNIGGVTSKDNDDWYLQKFRFSELDIGEADSQPANLELARSLASTGKISIAFNYVKNHRRVAPRDEHPELKQLEGIKEQDLKGKALSHQAILGTKMSVNARSRTRSDLVSAEPFATFNFKYRSHEALRADEIIPRSPSPIPLEERGVQNLSFDERGQLLERLLAEPRVKRELPDDDDVAGGQWKRQKTKYIEDKDGAVILD
ncbi:hypothetical protein BDV96DRAFT_679310 [Lophiotrema nucula]|uniref:DUF7918 domain-containing protein n=1 Tax=Lophiotrema nucula TaxID=690887 RepID=A0A6A5ZDB8_9PLEO|nr:hypothetical protein BDV96DRAFT_679310 [Lophiotrema nucula]